jgi:hypothetical protein
LPWLGLAACSTRSSNAQVKLEIVGFFFSLKESSNKLDTKMYQL